MPNITGNPIVSTKGTTVIEAGYWNWQNLLYSNKVANLKPKSTKSYYISNVFTRDKSNTITKNHYSQKRTKTMALSIGIPTASNSGATNIEAGFWTYLDCSQNTKHPSASATGSIVLASRLTNKGTPNLTSYPLAMAEGPTVIEDGYSAFTHRKKAIRPVKIQKTSHD